MSSRIFRILVVPWLFAASVILPLGPTHATSALVCGALALVLSGFTAVDGRARVGVALLSGWVALSAFVFHSTFLEETVTVTWGMAMFVSVVGPFSGEPRIQRTTVPARAVVTAPAAAVAHREERLAA